MFALFLAFSGCFVSGLRFLDYFFIIQVCFLGLFYFLFFSWVETEGKWKSFLFSIFFVKIEGKGKVNT